MALGQDAASLVCQGDSKRASILEPEDKRRTDQGRDILVRREIDRALDSMKTRDRQSIPGQPLVSRDLVRHLAQHLTLAG